MAAKKKDKTGSELVPSAQAADRGVVGTVGAFDRGAWTHTPVDAQCDGAYRLYCVER